MPRFGLFVAVVALFTLGTVATGLAQEDDTVLEQFSSIVDDTTCGDGIGRAYRDDTLFAAARNDDAAGFFARHEACAGISGRAAESGATPLPLGLIAQCSPATELPGWQEEWIICQLGFNLKEGFSTPIRIELSEFGLVSSNDQPFHPYTGPELYAGQINDMSAGLDVTGPDPAIGVVAFPVYPGQVEPPFVIGWARAGNFIIADELEPDMATIFIRDMQE